MNAAELHRHYRPGDVPAEEEWTPKRCGATCKRTGRPCKAWACKGRSRCRMHSGKARRGIGHPNYKHGKRSRDLVARMVADYEKALAEHQADTQHLLPILERTLDNMAGGTDSPRSAPRTIGSPACEQVGAEFPAPAGFSAAAGVETG
jgi:hypothetical protein